MKTIVKLSPVVHDRYPNTLLKLWVDGHAQAKAKERLPDGTVRVSAMSMLHQWRGEGQHHEHGTQTWQTKDEWHYSIHYKGVPRKRVEITDYTNPTFIYVADGETQTVEPATHTPDWLPPRKPIDEFKADMFKEICDVANLFDEVNLHERAHRKYKLDRVCRDIPAPDDIEDETERALAQGVLDEIDNATNFHRAWVGAAWYEIKNLAADADDALRLKAIEHVLELRSQLPDTASIKRFQDRHNHSAWKSVLRKRQLHKVRISKPRGKLEVKPGDTYGSRYTKVQWAKILREYYVEAVEYCHDLEETTES